MPNKLRRTRNLEVHSQRLDSPICKIIYENWKNEIGEEMLGYGGSVQEDRSQIHKLNATYI